MPYSKQAIDAIRVLPRRYNNGHVQIVEAIGGRIVACNSVDRPLIYDAKAKKWAILKFTPTIERQNQCNP